MKLLIPIIILFSSTLLLSQETQCDNGIDDDADGLIDCGDSDCIDLSVCSDAFACTNTLYQVISSSLKQLDPLTGQYVSIGDASSNYNGAGFNVQDGYIYGVKSNSQGIHLWKINNQGEQTDLGVIANFSGRTYVGDFDENGNLYTYKSGSNATLSYVDVNESTLESITVPITALSGSTPGSADITYNPRLKLFLGLSGGHELFAIDHINHTSEIKGDFTGPVDVSGSFGAAWSDKNGSSYFANNNTGKIFKFDFDNDGNVSSVAHVATGQPTNSNDGMGCFFSLPPFETNCNDNIDNDGDGYIDCADPDCAVTGNCPSLKAKLRSIAESGPSSLIPFHLTLINNSQVEANDFSVLMNLPAGFSFASDTLEISNNATYTGVQRPIEDEITQFTWGNFSLPVGDTLTISMSILSASTLTNDTYSFSFEVPEITTTPFSLSHDINIDESIFFGPEPYSCEPAFYQVYKKRGEPNVMGKLNVETSQYDSIAIINPQANGLGFDQNSGYAYGSDGKKFIRIDHLGNVAYMGFDFDKKVFVGDVDGDGQWYGKAGGNMVQVDLASNQIVATFSGQGMTGWDMAYNIDGNFYAVHKDDLYKFDPYTNSKSSLGKISGDQIPLSGHGAQWTGSDGYHYISNNRTGKIYRIDVVDKTALLVMQAEANLQYNDGFSCPTEIPPVFSYDYGDFSLFPVARSLVFEQDISGDFVPDYKMVWLGQRISKDAVDISNTDANSDQYDDGIVVLSNFDPSQIGQIQVNLNVNQAQEVFYGLWIDWDQDGTAENFYQGNEFIQGDTSIILDIDVPFDFAGLPFATRIRTSSKAITNSNIGGDILEPGEVEDFILSADLTELCSNGVDDNNDGLVDCDDPTCSEECGGGNTTSGGNGGLESNGNLIDKIIQLTFNRKKENDYDFLDKDKLIQFSGSSNKTSNATLEDFIPVDLIPGTETFINSPQHLIDVTRATDLFAVDIFEGDLRVAAILALETPDEVYEHTKYVCDRLTGSEIVDIIPYKIDGVHDFLLTKMLLPNGTHEYSISFSLRNSSGNNKTLESHWNLESYPTQTSYINFQIWANNTNYLFQLCLEILRLVEDFHPIDSYNITSAPEVYVSKGELAQDTLKLTIHNPLGLTYLDLSGTLASTETRDVTTFQERVFLSGALVEEITLNIGWIYYAGLTLNHPDLLVTDEIFAASGSWGISFEEATETVQFYDVVPTAPSRLNAYNVARNIQIAGTVNDYISLYRSFTPRFADIDLEEFLSLNLSAYGEGTIEVSVLKSSVTDWAEQAKYVFELSESVQHITLGKDFFDNGGLPLTWEDSYMIIFNILGNGTDQSFEFNLEDVHFGNRADQLEYLITTESNIVAPSEWAHSANGIDNTDMGSIEFTADKRDEILTFTIYNPGVNPIYTDGIELIDNSGNFNLDNAELQEILPGASQVFSCSYNPDNFGNQDNAAIEVFIATADHYHVIPIQISVEAVCPLEDDVSTQDLSITTSRSFYTASQRLSSNADVQRTIFFGAGEEIILNPQFEVSGSGTIEISITNECQTNE